MKKDENSEEVGLQRRGSVMFRKLNFIIQEIHQVDKSVNNKLQYQKLTTEVPQKIFDEDKLLAI